MIWQAAKRFPVGRSRGWEARQNAPPGQPEKVPAEGCRANCLISWCPRGVTPELPDVIPFRAEWRRVA
jgi:hypothetical protein